MQRFVRSLVCILSIVGMTLMPAAYAQTPTVAGGQISADDVNFQRPYVIGIVAFNKGDYDRAKTKFREALQVIPNHQGALTYLMVAGFNSQDGKTTAEAGDRLIAAGDDSSQTLFIAAKGHRLAGNEAKAREYFSLIADRDDDPYLDSAELALSESGLNYRPKGLRGSIILAYEHDSNIPASPTDSSTSSGSGISDNRWVITTSLQYNRRLGQRYYVGGSLILLDQFNHRDEAKNLEIDLARFGVHGGMVGNGWDVKLGIEHEDIGFGHDEYLQTDRAVLTYNQRITNNYRISLLGKIADDTFRLNNAQDAIKTDFEFNNSILLPSIREGARLSLDYRYRDNNTDHTSVYSYNSDQYRIGFLSSLPWWSTYVDVSYRLEKRNYDEPNPTIKRRDTYRESSLKLGKVWTRNVRNEIYYRSYDDNSNIDTYDYDQETTGINIIYSF